MTSRRKSLSIRRATPLDAVNLYKLLADDEKRTGTGSVWQDEGRGIALVLETILTGYVAVAVHSGRLVGSIGCALGRGPSEEQFILVGLWLAISPSFATTKIGPKLAEGLLKFADLYSHTVEVTAHPNSTLIELLSPANGFELKRVIHVREPGLSERTAQPAVQPAPAPVAADVDPEWVPPELPDGPGEAEQG